VIAVAPRLDLKSAIGRFRAELDEVSQAPSPTPELLEKLANDGAYLSTVQRDIQQNVRRPISYTEISAIQELLELLIGVLSQEVVSSALKTPVSASSLEENGYNLLDQISEYSIVAEHFFDEDVKKAREKLTTNEVCIDVKAISDMSKDIKKDVLKYIADVLKSFASFKG
jgi:hypothetical protein